MWSGWKRKRQEIAKLTLVSAEVDRELQDVAARQSNAVTRASIVLAGAGVSVFATINPDNLAASLLPSGLSFIAALLSLEALRYWESTATQTNATYIQGLMAASLKDAHWRLLSDKHQELHSARADLKRKSMFVTSSTGFLIAAWTSVAAITFVITPIVDGTGY